MKNTQTKLMYMMLLALMIFGISAPLVARGRSKNRKATTHHKRKHATSTHKKRKRKSTTKRKRKKGVRAQALSRRRKKKSTRPTYNRTAPKHKGRKAARRRRR